MLKFYLFTLVLLHRILPCRAFFVAYVQFQVIQKPSFLAEFLPIVVFSVEFVLVKFVFEHDVTQIISAGYNYA